jgi:uncharacterized protein (TIGR00255 family)
LPRSMTAFGRGQAPAGEGHWVVEIRTLNSRFLDFHPRIPSGLNALEERIKKHIAKNLTRGRVNLSIRASGAAEPPPKLSLNRPLVRAYRKVLDELRGELKLDCSLGLEPFLGNRDIIVTEDEAPNLKEIWAGLEPALNQAISGLQAMRQAEGNALVADLNQRIDLLAGLFAKVAERTPEIVKGYRDRLNQRISELLDNHEPDPQRLAMEVAIVADKCDVAEEAVRAQSHLEQFRGFLAQNEPVGRKLDFLIQELNREANTMGSKSPDADASALVVEIKAELERVREQVQNLE